jgi:hypothetical protein
MVDHISPARPVQNLSGRTQESVPKQENKAANKGLSAEDRVTLSQGQEVPTYGKLAGVEVATPYRLLQQLVIKTLNDQGITSLISTGETLIDLATLTPEDATELISEDGYFGVDKTSQRIVDFAINAFGNDPTKLDQMKDAIEKGFQEAAAVFGGKLPEISHQTYAAVIEKLDKFAQNAGEEKGVDHG